MEIFIGMYIMFGVIAITSKLFKTQNRRLYIAISCYIVLWLIQSLRDITIGHDSYNTYLPFFSGLSSSVNEFFDFNLSINFEYGYQLLTRFIKVYITSDENIFLSIISAIVLIPITITIYRYSNNILLSFIVYASFILYHFSFSGLRQAIAISLVFYSYRFIVKRNIYLFLVFVFLAMSMHTSAIFFLPAYFLWGRKIPFSLTIGIIIAWIAIILISPETLNMIVMFLFGGEKYQSYLGQGTNAYNLLIVYILFYLLFWLKKDNDKSALFYKNMFFMVVIIQCLGLVSNVADRIGYYFLIFLSLIIPKFLSNYSKSYKELYGIITVILMIAFFFYTSADGYLEVVPYKFFWQ